MSGKSYECDLWTRTVDECNSRTLNTSRVTINNEMHVQVNTIFHLLSTPQNYSAVSIATSVLRSITYLKTLEGRIANTLANNSQDLWMELDMKRRDHETLIEYQTKGAIIRSKSRWYNEGEKNTKYFLSLEKRHCKQGTITQLRINENKLVQSDREILYECETFYKNLYRSKTQVSDFPEDFFPPTRELLNDEKRSSCEGQLTAKECLEALKDMAAGKSPGTDGLPCEFYMVFWEDIGETLTSAFHFSYEICNLTISQRRGIVKVIPKKDSDPVLIKNWRP